MNDVVVLNKKESIALIQIQNPPVNALSHAVRQGLMEASINPCRTAWERAFTGGF